MLDIQAELLHVRRLPRIPIPASAGGASETTVLPPPPGFVNDVLLIELVCTEEGLVVIGLS